MATLLTLSSWILSLLGLSIQKTKNFQFFLPNEVVLIRIYIFLQIHTPGTLSMYAWFTVQSAYYQSYIEENKSSFYTLN